MPSFIVARTLHSLMAMLAISMIAFGLSHLTGSPVDALLPIDASAADAERLIEAWGLDRPLHVQYVVFLGRALQGDLGMSLREGGQSAMGVVWQRLPATLQLAGFSLLIGTIIAIPIGLLAAVHKGTPMDSLSKVIALLGQALPSFWLGIILIWVFSVYLGWFPASGYGGLSHMVLPAIAMGWFHVAALMRLTRSAALEVLDAEYIKLARVKGLPEWKIIWKHVLRNAAITPLTYFGLIAGMILTGSVVIETVFAWPGTGLLSVEAIRARDFPVVQAVVLTFGVIFILVNLLVDILYAFVDPRIRYK